MILLYGSKEFYSELKKMHKRSSKKAFINGVFDIVHAGHIKMINHAKKWSNEVIVAINSDESASRLNKSHPLINTEINRALLLNEIADYVIIFDDDNASELIKFLMPDYYFKGLDYENKSIPEKNVCDLIGTELLYYDSGLNLSSSKIIERIKEL